MSGNRNPIYLQLFRQCPREALHFSIYPVPGACQPTLGTQPAVPRACQPTRGHTAEARWPQGEEWRGPAWRPREPSSAPKPEAPQRQSVSISLNSKGEMQIYGPMPPVHVAKIPTVRRRGCTGEGVSNRLSPSLSLGSGAPSLPAASESPRKSKPPVPFDPTLPHRARGTHMAVPDSTGGGPSAGERHGLS